MNILSKQQIRSSWAGLLAATLLVASDVNATIVIVTPVNVTDNNHINANTTGSNTLNGATSGLAFATPATINSVADLPKHNEDTNPSSVAGFHGGMWLTGSGGTGALVFDLGSVQTV